MANYAAIRPYEGEFLMRSWLDAKVNGMRLVKLQLCAFNDFAAVRTCMGWNEEVKHSLHAFECIERPVAITNLMIEVENLTIRRDIGRNIREVMQFPHILIDNKLFAKVAGLLDKLYVEILRDVQRLNEWDLQELMEKGEEDDEGGRIRE